MEISASVIAEVLLWQHQLLNTHCIKAQGAPSQRLLQMSQRYLIYSEATLASGKYEVAAVMVRIKYEEVNIFVIKFY